MQDSRIKKATEYIALNYSRKITLDILAQECSLSRYHFSRLFRKKEGISPVKYLRRYRVRAAAEMLQNDDRSVTEIALDAGFESLAKFDEAFRDYFSTSPSLFRKSQNSKNRKTSGNKRIEPRTREEYSGENTFLRRIWDMNLEIKNFPAWDIAYYRHTGNYLDVAGNWQRLLKWVRKQDLDKLYPKYIGISHDDPANTPEHLCRHDACVTLPAGYEKPQGTDISYDSLPGGMYAVYHFYDKPDKMAIIFRSLFTEWLPESGYEMDERPLLEINLNDPATHPEGKGRCDICIPVRKI